MIRSSHNKYLKLFCKYDIYVLYFSPKWLSENPFRFVNLATQILEKMFGMFDEEIKEWHRIIKEILNEKKTCKVSRIYIHQMHFLFMN